MTAPAIKTAGVQGKRFGRKIEVEVPAIAGERTESTARVAAAVGMNADGYLDARHQPAANRWKYVGAAAGITVNTAVEMVAAPGAAVQTCIHELELQNIHATAETVVELLDDTTAVWRGFVNAQDNAGASYVAVRFDPPLKITANKALNIKCLSASAVIVNARGHKETVAS